MLFKNLLIRLRRLCRNKFSCCNTARRIIYINHHCALWCSILKPSMSRDLQIYLEVAYVGIPCFFLFLDTHKPSLSIHLRMVSQERLYPCLSSILSLAKVGLLKISMILDLILGFVWLGLIFPICLEISPSGPSSRYLFRIFLFDLTRDQAHSLPLTKLKLFYRFVA